MLIACPAAISAGIVEGRIHYPSAALTADDSTTPDTRPLILISPDETHHTRIAELGDRPLPGGTLIATIVHDGDIGTIETLASAMASELQMIVTGLPINGVSLGLCSEPSSGARAADETKTTASFRRISLTIQWGLNA
jgi:hypothetical protein